MPDDYSSDLQTTGVVTVGGSATGEIETAGDRDWFAVTLEAGRSYRIDLEGTQTWDGTLRDPYLYGIHDAAGNLLSGTTDNNGGAGRNSRVVFTAAEDATYYVAAGASLWAGVGVDQTGTYTLSVEEVAEDFAAGTGTAGAVEVGGSATGEIEVRGDRDWFAVTLEAGRSYRIDLEGSETGGGSLGNPYLRGIHDAAGNLLSGTTDNNGGVGRNSRVEFTAAEDATYYVAAGAGGGRRGDYTLSVADVTDDFAAGPGTSGAVEVGGSATGEIEVRGDRDWFAVTLEAGRTYRIDLEGSETGGGSLGNPYLRGIYDAAGNLLSGTTDNNGGVGRNSRMEFTAAEDATYYVAAGAGGGRRGDYTLSVEEVAEDFAAGPGTSGAVEVGGSAPGTIERAGDQDWFAVTLEAGRTYRIDLEGSETGGGTLDDPYLHGVYDASGALLSGTTDDDGGEGRNSRMEFTATEDAAYYVAAGAYGSRTGNYTLSVADVSDDFAAGPGTSGTVEVGGSATGEIDYEGDRDWFAVDLLAGTTYRFELETARRPGPGPRSDPYLRGVYDASGDLLYDPADDGEGTASRVEFTATENATYYVETGADGEARATYRLSVRNHADDFTADTGTDGEVKVGGSVTGNIKTQYDRDWFAVTLVGGTAYRIDLESPPNPHNYDPHLYGIHDAAGKLLSGTTNGDGGEGYNSRVFFTPPLTEADGPYYPIYYATYYVVAGADGPLRGGATTPCR